MLKIRNVVIDTDDLTLEGASDRIEEAVNKVIEEIDAENEWKVVGVHVMSANQAYSEPIEGSHRDYHYNDTGFIAVLTLDDKPSRDRAFADGVAKEMEE